MIDRPPNILFLFPDQHRYDWLKCATPELPLHTPNVDALAARGMRFTNAYTPSPLCGPARTCIAAGKSYAANPVQDHSTNLPLDAETFYQRLRDAGYQTGSVGKLDLAKAYENWHRDGKRFLEEWGFTDGFDSEGKYDGSRTYLENPNDPPGPYLRALKERGVADLYAQEHANRPIPSTAYITQVPDDLYNDNWVADNAMDVLRNYPTGQPWFLQVNFPGPHDPNDVTQTMHDRWADVDFPLPHKAGETDPAELLLARQHYAAMIENIDAQCGRLIAEVKRRGEFDDTVVIYSSDHGEMLGDHGRWQKAIWYEPSAHVPLVVAGPSVQAGVVSSALLTLEDLAPTLIELAGAEPLIEADAQSLVPVLRGDADTHRDVVVSALTVPGRSDWRMVFDGRNKLVVTPGEPDQLYDLETDPREDTDVAAAHPDICHTLRSALEA